MRWPFTAPRCGAKLSSTCLPLLLLSLVAGGEARATDPVKVGGELVVSDGTLDSSYYPSLRIAADPAGNFLVAWKDYDYGKLGEIVKGHAFWSTGNSQGPVVQISNDDPLIHAGGGSTYIDSILDVAADGAGNFVVAYVAWDEAGLADPDRPCQFDQPCIWTKRRDANGNLAPADFIVGDPRILPYTLQSNQTANPELAVSGDAGFVIAWEGYDLTPVGEDESEGVWARRLVASGQVNGKQFRVNEEVAYDQGNYGELDVATDAEGDFVMVWADEGADPSPYGGIVFRRFDSAKNPLGSQSLVTADGRRPHVARLPDGTFMVIWETESSPPAIRGHVFGPSGASVSGEFEVSSDGAYPEIGASAGGSFIVVFQRNYTAGAGVRVFDGTGTPTSTELDVGSDTVTPTVAAAASGDFVVAWHEYQDYAYVQRFQATPPAPVEIPLLGKVLVLTNKIPDDFAKSKGKWKAGGDDLVVPLRGSSSDPRCLGDAPGTVKASVRFTSPTSGQDVIVDLPCQNWSVTGSNKVSAVARRGFRYKDRGFLDGPCNSVKITGTKTVSVSCKGKPDLASFGYDLQSGVSQGAVTTVLQLGLYRYCAEFEPFSDGSDGKKYKGKGLAPPASCP